MSVGPQLAGSCATFGLGILLNLFLYLKHKRKRVLDLLEDFQALNGEVDDLLARWKDVNDWVDDNSNTVERNEQFNTKGDKVLAIESRFNKIKERFNVLLTAKAEVALTLNMETELQRLPDAETENEKATSLPVSEMPQEAPNEGQKNDQAIHNQKQASDKAGSKIITNSAARDYRTDIDQSQKIWTRKFFKLAKLDKDITKLHPRVSVLMGELDTDHLTRRARPKVVHRLPAEELRVIPSHQKYLDDLLNFLINEGHKRIGIHGAPRVGKTNILRNLNNCFDSSSHPSKYWNLDHWNLDHVIWVTAKHEKVIETMQEEIIGRLNLTCGKNITQNADIISSALSKKKCLLLVDDFHPLVQLENVGIRKEHLQVKVVVAAKNFNALINAKLDETIEIKALELKESQELFKHLVVNYEGLSERHKNLIHPILRLTGGLLEVITLTAAHLNVHREYEHWKGFKERSQMGTRIHELLGMEHLLELYKGVYTDLRVDEFKKCLLYAALFPTGYEICRKTLVECWKAENFIICSSPTLRAARYQGAIIFTQLEASSLMQSCGENYVKMSAFFRKVAFNIPFPNEQNSVMCVRSPMDRDGDLDEKEWNDVKMVSFVGKNMNLPSCPKGINMSTLFLLFNLDLKLIESAFFKKMNNLRVLNLHGTGIRALPSSISNLGALRCLYLNDCGGLTKLPNTIVQIKEIEVLDIRGTSIPSLPKEILRLVNLRCLRISFPDKAPEGWRFVPRRFLPNKTWVVIPPDMHKSLCILEYITVAVGGEVTDEIRAIVRRELAEFRKREYFDYDLQTYLAQSFDFDSQPPNIQTGGLSNVSEGPAGVSPSNDPE